MLETLKSSRQANLTSETFKSEFAQKSNIFKISQQQTKNKFCSYSQVGPSVKQIILHTSYFVWLNIDLFTWKSIITEFRLSAPFSAQNLRRISKNGMKVEYFLNDTQDQLLHREGLCVTHNKGRNFSDRWKQKLKEIRGSWIFEKVWLKAA